MKEPLPDYFFDLADFAHAQLFDRDRPVWEALKHLTTFFSSLPLGRIETQIPEGVTLDNPELISIGQGSCIEPGAYIKGPCYLGPDCVVRHGAYIRGYLLAGERCVIGHDTEIKHAILLNDAHAAHFNYVGDSILGNRSNLGAGVKCANLKLDRNTVAVLFGSEMLDTGMHKLGAIIGDDVQIGCNAVLNPGTCLGKAVQCHPCINLGGFFPSHSSSRGAVQRYTPETAGAG